MRVHYLLMANTVPIGQVAKYGDHDHLSGDIKVMSVGTKDEKQQRAKTDPIQIVITDLALGFNVGNIDPNECGAKFLSREDYFMVTP